MKIPATLQPSHPLPRLRVLPRAAVSAPLRLASSREAPYHAFTLIELLVSISIIALLATILTPTLGRVVKRAESTKCANNLRQIGLAAISFAQDNGNRFPKIEPNPGNPVYTDDADAGTLLETLAPYGLTEATLRCPSDVAKNDNFAELGTSYEWRPFLDDELLSAPKFYSRRGVFTPPLSRIRIATDFDRVHNGRQNRLYADGHVKSY